VILAPSILSIDFGHMAEEMARAERGGAGMFHLDVMDGHFVPNLTIGPAVVKAARRATRLPLDLHLMIEHADLYLDAFVDAGADWISLHVEALTHLHRAVTRLRERGVKAGAALNPSTPLASVEEILPDLDYVVVMSVNPGFGGQRFIASSLDKVKRMREVVRRRGLSIPIEVDGGVDETNIKSLVEAGAELLVAGTAVFGQGDAEAASRRLLEAAR
jgi:ribulose-phosphate 3-epimerase